MDQWDGVIDILFDVVELEPSRKHGTFEFESQASGISRMSYPGNPGEFWNQLELADAESISLRDAWPNFSS